MIPCSRRPPPAVWLTIAVLAAATSSSDAAKVDASATMRFAADMAREGNWREALYRWSQLLSVAPDNPRLLNNLAVAHEALGEAAEAAELYGRAATLAPDDDRIESNHARFRSFWRDADDGENAANGVVAAADGEKPRGSGNPIKVTVSIPTPPRLDASGMKTLLVTSLLDDESELLDTGAEMVRFLRSEFRKNTELDVLDVVPAPAIPEQHLDALKTNREFWRHLGSEYEADLIVSGIVTYDRRDHSGFRDIDRVNPVTGHKTRRTEFVEQEQFGFEMDVLFLDGATGELLFHDRLRRSSVYQGSQNDPITAFYELAETLTPDLLAAVKPRMQTDTRVIFRQG
jgi:tetratricopeptide (TPR) repeat protein